MEKTPIEKFLADRFARALDCDRNNWFIHGIGKHANERRLYLATYEGVPTAAFLRARRTPKPT